MAAMMKTSDINRQGCLDRQRGVNTLFVTLVLLLLSGLVLLYTSRGAVNEQRLSANEIRTKQAFAAASAGLEHALAYMASGGASIDHNNDQVVDTIYTVPINTVPIYTVPNEEDPLYIQLKAAGQFTPYDEFYPFNPNSPKKSYYQFAFCSPSVAAPTCPTAHTTAITCTAPKVPPAVATTEFTRPLIVACGWSDDDTSVVRITQAAAGSPALPGKITSPVVSKGTANLLTGGASIFNYFNDLTVWSGLGLPSLSNTAKTFVRDVANYATADASLDSDGDGEPDYRDTGNSPNCGGATGYVCATQGSSIGHDTVVNDTNLSSLTSDQFFLRNMGKLPSVYRDTVATWVVDLPGGTTLTQSNSTDINSISNMGDAAIWVEGNASLSGTIGTKTHPVVLIVNGDLALGNNVVINGLVYVTGTFSGNGTPTIYGSLIANDVAASGNLKVIYDPSVLGDAGGNGQAAALQGSWKDW